MNIVRLYSEKVRINDEGEGVCEEEEEAMGERKGCHPQRKE